MSGNGGNVVKLPPNDTVGFRKGNGGSVPVEQVIVVADQIRPCHDYLYFALQEPNRK